ncbi:MAG: hypothetical protein IKY16_09845 [Bacteroidales bacterium]|nr:hypothetical protein [Bacteroidales bacterium]
MSKDKKYKWEFENIGGSLRVKIASGTDIAHLSELDPKMWTVLSCPVKGLEINEKSLSYIDQDADGKIRINDVVKTAEWITGALKNPDLLLQGSDSIEISQFNTEDASGAKLAASSRQILSNLDKEGETISMSDTADIAAIFAKTRFNGDGVITEASSDDADDKAAIAAAVATIGGVQDRSGAMGVDAATVESFYKTLADYAAWCDAAVELPYADQTDKALDAYEALDAKVKDYFMRAKLAAFSPDSTASLDVQTSRIEAISAENLTGKTDDIAAYPIARITGKPEIDLGEPVNPAWAAQFDTLRSIAVDPSKKTLTEADWNEIGGRFAAYTAWKAAKAGAAVEGLGIDAVKGFLAKDRKASLMDLIAQDEALKQEASDIDMVDKFLHIYRDFYRLLRNFVTFNDFYSKDDSVFAIFQSGTLIIDQRECRLCMNVADMGKHNATAAVSGMYLIYCECTAKDKPAKLQIVAAMTVGDIGDLFVGKNAVYYDNAGAEWDAVITKIIDNPISVSQAFWSPYRRMAKAIENLISKSAADKDAKIMSDATAKINAAPAALPAAGADGKPAAAPPFDIAKFAGIFAAIGVAVGMIGTALSGLLDGLSALAWWELIIVFISIMLVISGPAMIMAWLKLRRRNIAPLLNANGWAVNAASKISIPFGETLTDQAKFPKIKIKDPYAKAGLSPFSKILITVLAIAVIAAGLWLFNLLSFAGLDSPLPRYRQADPVEEVVEAVQADTLTTADTLIAE